MELTIDIEFSEMEIPPRCHKLRAIDHKDKVKIKIKEATPEEAPIAFIVHQFRKIPNKIRIYKGQLYREARISYYDGKDLKVYPFEETRWDIQLKPCRSFGQIMTKAECLAYMKAQSKQYLIVDREIYIQCYEPYYHIITFGYHGCGTAIFPDYSVRSRKVVYGYSALDKDRAIKDAITIATGRGDERDIPKIKECIQGWIEVIMPECCKRKYKPQIQDSHGTDSN